MSQRREQPEETCRLVMDVERVSHQCNDFAVTVLNEIVHKDWCPKRLNLRTQRVEGGRFQRVNMSSYPLYPCSFEKCVDTEKHEPSSLCTAGAPTISIGIT